MIAASSSADPLPADTEARVAQFTELVATAIANADAREQITALAAEQAALGRIGTLVAREPSPGELFEKVAEETANLLGRVMALVIRADGHEFATIVGAWGLPEVVDRFPVGMRIPLDNRATAARVILGGRPARTDDYANLTGPIAESARAAGVQSTVACPIVVGSRTWGAVTVSTVDGEVCPPETEQRLLQVAELLSTAIANADARAQVQRLAEEQAALRRVATLVARGETPGVIFAAVSEEIERAFTMDETTDLATVVRFDPGPEFVVVGAAKPFEGLAIGSRWGPKDVFVSTKVFYTGRSARVEESDWPSAEGDDAERLRELGLLSQVGSPIIVSGRVWGAISMDARNTLPPDTEERLEKFTELVATAIANAEARSELSLLLEEQAALRQVATLVADQAAPRVIFASVAEELARTVAADRCAIARYEENDALSIVAYWSDEEQDIPAGTLIDVSTDEVVATLRQSGQMLRIDDHEAFSGPLMDYARTLGALPTSTIAAPVFVGGRMWGTIFTSTMAAIPFPEGTEARVLDFAELVATAIANADSREALAGLVEEQAALRRVATLVAEGVPPTDIFDAVSKEVQGVLHLDAAPSDVATVVRFESPTECVLVGASKPIEESALGSRWEPHDVYVSTRVLRTGKSARLDEDDVSVAGPEAEKMRRQGYFSQVACPIVVEGRLWGAMTASATEPLPPETESRLEKFTELVATAIANAQGKSELAASRRRIVAASDATRRRIERDLHDGTQQRLVSLGLALRAAEENVPPDRPELRAELSRVVTGLAGAVEDLQELSRGIHPAILSRGGLVPALRTLARRSEIPVDLDASANVLVPEPVEVAAYFVASEALANAIKHAEPSQIHITLVASDGHLLLTIRDDGKGGADPSRGSGLIGLTDRVDVLGGSLEIDSRRRAGTQITARLPLDLETAEPAAPL
jgi:signal transduction histidine kinase